MTVIYAPHQKKDHTKAKAQTAKLKDRAGIVSACMLARSRIFEIRKFNKPVLNKVVKFWRNLISLQKT